MNVRRILITSATLSLLTIPTVHADQEFTYDGGKRAAFCRDSREK